jgi:diguanylate cyclase (GGDEF)-like protein/PAS domain S-box-containing protein
MKSPSPDELRRIAEGRLQVDVTPATAMSASDAQKIIYELQVYQIELEMQNSELSKARDGEAIALYRYTELFDFAPIAYFSLDQSSKIMQVNFQGARLLGLERDSLIGRRFLIYVTEQHRVILSDFLEKVLETTGRQSCEILVQAGQNALWLSLEASIGMTATDCLVTMYDITEQKRAEEKLKRITYYDVLTDLPNRILIIDRLSHAIEHCQQRNRSLVVAYMNLDGFKAVNVSHGYNVGDRLLIALSHRMKESLREGDALARVGGDEFVVVMFDLEKPDDSEPLLKRLLEAAADPVVVDDALIHVSASIGVTFYPQGGVDADKLMRHSYQAMHVAKQAGKNRCHLFDSAQDNTIKIQREAIGDVRSALDRREFVLHYQPKVNMRTGQVIGVEALIRWHHPYRGIVPPSEFLPAIEGHAVSLELGEWVIDTVLCQISQWQSLGVDLPISANISAYQLQQANFTTRLVALLTAHSDVNPHSLELEILETNAFNKIGQVSAAMTACHELGVRFALGGVGTGYSSLTYLKRLPVDLIKIDQRFVRGMLEDVDDLAVVEGVVSLAKAFQREVIAEGVETIAHGIALLQLGCELAQGYGIARPMPAGDISQWVSSWKANEPWRAIDCP